ncbi:MAG: LacI family transcriptional regulator [Lachnospiraceae bacterium]|jgi:LacI family transcriptional regulator|nr:LacI family transcriptional regulator [Lachnospiraceae bacterium]
MKEIKSSSRAKVTIVDVAKYAGVVPSTVSHVLNGTAQITDETKAKVLHAIEVLHYTPNASARNLRQKRTRLIGVVLQDISSEFYAKCTASMLKEALKDNYALMVMDACFDNNNVKAQVSALIERRVEGIVFVGGGNDEDILQEVEKYNIPVVLGDRNDGRHPCVEFNNEETVYRLICALHESGYRKFAYAGEPLEIQENLKFRYQGFVRGLDACGVPQKDRINIVTKDLHIDKIDAAYAAFMRLFTDERQKPIPDVILTSNDLIAQGFVAAALSNGIKVPQEVGIVGFDDISISKFFQPPLTTICQDKDELGIHCYRLLKKVIEGSKEQEHVILKQKIKNRKTTNIPDEIMVKYLT